MEHVKIHVHPADSPDLNPIEHIWGLMKDRLELDSFEKFEDFKKAIETMWWAIPTEEI